MSTSRYQRLLDVGWLVHPSSGCWLWKGTRNRKGYGVVHAEGRSWLAHRLSFELHHRALTPLVRHRCDTPACVRPDHLLAGTPQSNADDAVRRGRTWHPPCPAGHDLTLPGATYPYADGSRCVECRKARARRGR